MATVFRITGRTNLADPRYDSEYGMQVQEDITIIEDICINTKVRMTTTSEETVQRIIHKMKKGKAAYGAGITAEHLELAVEELTPILTDLINTIIEKREIPSQLKTGILTPVLKKERTRLCQLVTVASQLHR